MNTLIYTSHDEIFTSFLLSFFIVVDLRYEKLYDERDIISMTTIRVFSYVLPCDHQFIISFHIGNEHTLLSYQRAS